MSEVLWQCVDGRKTVLNRGYITCCVTRRNTAMGFRTTPVSRGDLLESSAPVLLPTMPLGTPYHSFALPYPIRVDNFTDTIDDLPAPYNRPRLHLLTHTHSDHIAGLASKSFAYRVICSPDAKEMLLRHELYTERSLHDHEYRAEKKKTFSHLKVNPYVMPNGQCFFTGSRDLLVCTQFFSVRRN